MLRVNVLIVRIIFIRNEKVAGSSPARGSKLKE